MRRVSSTGSLPSRNVSPTRLFATVKGHQGAHRNKPGTSYCSALMNLVKATIGTGIFAMGGAMKNAGLVTGPILLITIGVICVHCQHLLVRAADVVASDHEYNVKPDYAETVLVSFMDGPEKYRNLSVTMKNMANFFLIIFQMGICCVYLVFLGDSLVRILAMYEIDMFSVRVMILFTTIPIWCMTLLHNLKLLVPMSSTANFLTIVCIIITSYYNCKDMDDPSRLTYYGELSKIPLFVGTAFFSFESIGLVLPLYNEMKNPRYLITWYGVLNIGMSYSITLTAFVGVTSYMKWGEDIKPSVTLNLPAEIMAQCVVIFITAVVALTYVLQMYVAYMIMFPWVYRKFGPFKHHYWVEVLFKTVLSAVAYFLAETIPYLGEFISLIGALGGTALALTFPCILDLIVFHETNGYFVICKDILIISLAVFTTISSTFFAMKDIVHKFIQDTSSL